MGLFKTTRRDYFNVHAKGDELRAIKKAAYDRFTPEILGLGDINTPSKPIDAVCAVFDLQGFTSFAGQVDPHLAVPDYLGSFLSWLFEEIRRVSVAKGKSRHRLIYAPLPFFSKFMGDGVLFLWDTQGLGEDVCCNIALMMHVICNRYREVVLTRFRGHPGRGEYGCHGATEA